MLFKVVTCCNTCLHIKTLYFDTTVAQFWYMVKPHVLPGLSQNSTPRPFSSSLGRKWRQPRRFLEIWTSSDISVILNANKISAAGSFLFEHMHVGVQTMTGNGIQRSASRPDMKQETWSDGGVILPFAQSSVIWPKPPVRIAALLYQNHSVQRYHDFHFHILNGHGRKPLCFVPQTRHRRPPSFEVGIEDDSQRGIVNLIPRFGSHALWRPLINSNKKQI